MKFWEALKEMEAGAVCGCSQFPSAIYEIRGERLKVSFNGGERWEPTHCGDLSTARSYDWRIVTPAPNDAKPEQDEAARYAREVEEVCRRQHEEYARKAGIPDPSEDVSLRMRTAKLENDVCELCANRDALAKRVEALERDEDERASLCEVMANGIQGNRERLSALEAKLAALEASKAQEAPTISATSRNRSEKSVAWPRNSLPWACAKAMERWTPKGGGNYFPRVRQRSHPTVAWRVEGIETSIIRLDRFLALDWEPCE